MKYLGIDYGSKYVGLAVSDSEARVAMPLEVLENTSDVFLRIKELVDIHRVEKVIVGESRNLDGGHNPIQAAIDDFSRELAQTTLCDIDSISEIFSSRQVKWGQEHALRENPRNTHNEQHTTHKRVDARAAAVILQSYLDYHNQL